MNFRDYQEKIIDKSIPIVLEHGFVYLAMEVRTGKTLTSLGIAKAMWMKNVLFITKKKAISSIEKDWIPILLLANSIALSGNLDTISSWEK